MRCGQRPLLYFLFWTSILQYPIYVYDLALILGWGGEERIRARRTGYIGGRIVLNLFDANMLLRA